MGKQKALVPFGKKVKLSDYDAGYTGGLTKQEAKGRLLAKLVRMAELQELMFAEGKHALLIILQAMDAGGKDSTIRHVMEAFNPQGCHVVGFGVPTDLERDHDFLWRIHPHTPGKGEIAVFNRSHYEDVLIVRVLGLAPEERWRKRYRHIREFEKLLADEGTTIIKLYLHISKEEQAERLQARLDDETKHWKFNTGDLKHRELWNEYMEAYGVALEKTSTEQAPWYVVPANSKWYRNIVITKTIVDTLEALNMEYPDPEEGLDEVVIT